MQKCNDYNKLNSEGEFGPLTVEFEMDFDGL